VTSSSLGPRKLLCDDEVSYGRGQNNYLTIGWDHEAVRVVWIGKDKEEETLKQFFAKLGPRRSRRLVAVRLDMAQGYIDAIQDSMLVSSSQITCPRVAQLSRQPHAPRAECG
jgi:transposase